MTLSRSGAAQPSRGARRWLLLAALAALPACDGCDGGPAPGAVADSGLVAASAVPPPAVPVATLPASDRVFAVASADGTCESILGGDGEHTWLAAADGSGKLAVRWRVEGGGELQLVAGGDLGRGRRLYLARGRGKSARSAPLTLAEVDPHTGEDTELFRHAGERNEAAHLSIADVDGDGRAELAFAYYADKYQVRTRHLHPDGTGVEGESVRMAASRAYADFDGDGRVDEAIGRPYGDAVDAPGDLRVRIGERVVRIATDRGVRALLAVEAPPARAALYFSDGWAKDYGRDARAQLKRAIMTGDTFQVELVGKSADDYTFFELFAVPGGGRSTSIVARGSTWATMFEPGSEGTWSARRVTSSGELQASAVCCIPGGPWALWLPGRDTTRAWSLAPR